MGGGVWGSYPGGNCPGGNCPRRVIVPGGNCPWRVIALGVIVLVVVIWGGGERELSRG